MVSYYNPLPYSQKHSAANLAYPAGQPWQWPTNYHTPPNHQFLGDIDSPHAHHQMYYNPMFHSAASAASDWHSPSSAENYSSPQNITSAHQMLHQHSIHSGGPTVGGATGSGGSGSSGNGGGGGGNTSVGTNLSSGSSSASAGPGSGHTTLNESTNSLADHHIAEGLPSPPITVSGSEISSPGAPASSASPHHVPLHLHSSGNNNNSPTSVSSNNINHNNNRQTSPIKSPYYDWMKKPTYPAQPTPGKTRTKDKYRVVYTDFQRLELEKEYCTSRYITIRRKTELAQALSLSERQVKIWFQNRRAKERKQSKKGSDSALSIQQQHGEYANLMDTKPKLEPGLQHLQHSLHSMSSMAAMSMPAAIGLHHHHHHLHGHHHHHALAAHSAAAAHHQSLHQSPHSQMSVAAVAAAASVGTLSM